MLYLLPHEPHKTITAAAYNVALLLNMDEETARFNILVAKMNEKKNNVNFTSPHRTHLTLYTHRTKSVHVN